MSTSKYAPELFEVFRKGAREKFEIILDDKAQAYSLRSRLNKLRVAMRTERHPMLDIAEGVSISIIKTRDNVLLIGPVDNRYVDRLAKAIGPVSDASKEAAAIMQTAIDAKVPKPKKTSQQALEEYFFQGEGEQQ